MGKEMTDLLHIVQSSYDDNNKKENYKLYRSKSKHELKKTFKKRK